jgi:hypothetical protein
VDLAGGSRRREGELRGPLKFVGRDACSAPLNVTVTFYETRAAMPYS